MTLTLMNTYLSPVPAARRLGKPGLIQCSTWSKSSHTYPAIGNVDYEFATLSEYKTRIPPPPERPKFVVDKGDDNLEIIIDAPFKKVYQTLINVDKRPEWLMGVDSINREMTSERIGMQHNCVFMGMVLINTAVYYDFGEDHSIYSEQVKISDIDATIMLHYDLYAHDGGGTLLNVNVNWMNAAIPAENRQAMMEAEIINLGLFKSVCENNPA